MKATSILMGICASAMLLGTARLEALPEEWHVSHGRYPEFPPGFVVRADTRFDPLLQRLMAERSLKALPLQDGRLLYIVPANVDPRIEEMQIRYLEWLLDQPESGRREPAPPGP